MTWLGNILGLYLGHAIIAGLWQWLELRMYGEVQERDVDTIITILYLAFVMIAYWKGRSDGHNDKNKEEDT